MDVDACMDVEACRICDEEIYCSPSVAVFSYSANEPRPRDSSPFKRNKRGAVMERGTIVGLEGNTNRPANHLAPSYAYTIFSGFILHKLL